MHKIAFAGFPGSGRTSVMAEVKKLLALKCRVEEVPDQRANSPFDFDQRSGFTSQFYFMSSQVNEENMRSQARPDFLLCDGSLLDHWLEWRSAAPHRDGDQDALLQNLYRFWMPTYDLVLRIRADVQVLKKRLAEAVFKEYPLERAQQADEQYGRIIEQDRIRAFDLWNNRSIDESAQEALSRLGEMKWLP